MKQMLESHLLHLVTRIHKATTLFKTFWKSFVFTYFLMCFLPTHGGACVKTQVSILRPGYIMEGWKICIKLTKLPNIAVTTFYHLPYFYHLTLIQGIFFKRNILWRMLKIPFLRLKISKFAGGGCFQTSPYKLAPPARVCKPATTLTEAPPSLISPPF